MRDFGRMNTAGMTNSLTKRIVIALSAVFVLFLCTNQSAYAIAPSGGFSTTTTGAGGGLTIDNAGNLYTVGTTDGNMNNRIYKRNASGTILWTSGSGSVASGGLTDASALAVDNTNNILWVGDSHRVSAFNTTTGAFIRTFGYGVSDNNGQVLQTCTSGCYQGDYYRFMGVNSLAVDSTGNVFVSTVINGYSKNVFKFTTNGAFVGEFGRDTGGMSLGDSGVIAIDSSDKLYVARTGYMGEDSYHAVIDVYNSTTNVQVGSVGASSGDGWLRGGAYGIGFDKVSGDMFVTNGGNGNGYRVTQFNSSGTFLRSFGWGVLNGADQFQSCLSNCLVGQFDGYSYSTVGPFAGSVNAANAIAIAPDHTIFVTALHTYYGVGTKVQKFIQSPWVGATATSSVAEGSTTTTVTYASDAPIVSSSCNVNGVVTNPCPSGSTVTIPSGLTPGVSVPITITTTDNTGKTGTGTGRIYISYVAPTGGTGIKITGKLKTGLVLSVVNNRSFWGGSEPTAYTYQWYRCSYKNTNCDSITAAAGGTAATFRIPTGVKPTHLREAQLIVTRAEDLPRTQVVRRVARSRTFAARQR